MSARRRTKLVQQADDEPKRRQINIKVSSELLDEVNTFCRENGVSKADIFRAGFAAARDQMED